METGVFEIELTDGRIFRIVYLNSSQKKRFINLYSRIKHKCKRVTYITNGLHTVTQFETILI